MFHLFNRYFSAKTVFIFVSESILLFLSVLLITALRFSFESSALFVYDPQFVKTIVLTVTYSITFYYFNMYAPDYYLPNRHMFYRLIQATIVATIILFCLFYIAPSFRAWRGIQLGTAIFLPLIILFWRMIFSKYISVELPNNRVLIIGSGDLAKNIGSDIYKHNVHGLQLVGFIDDDPAKLGTSIVNPGVVGGYGDIARIAKSEGIDRIIVALKDRRAKLPMSALLDCKLAGITIEEGETFRERATGKIPLDHLKPSWMVFSDGFKSLRTRKISKRIFDIILSAFVFVLAAPIMLVAAVIIRLESSGPVIFKQERVGENGKLFEIYKFRSMRQDAEKGTGPVWAGTSDDRVTRVGRFIRKTRIDELPQLINVIKGNMSFVGPRPERPYFVNKLKEVIPYYEMRSVTKPGITGWAQIKYPYGASVQDALEKLQFDIYYIKNMSPLLDLMIIFWTIKVVFSGSGAR
ncbi:MAG: TIGR03013 family PEP-CTERM/XrtA system glycosyltransferase [Proteobacteria bacterium]|nr:TIGR03013 family PEP-CTERM/XrtA system glycosyltransferase [Pseudomonadota bacterium]